MNEAHCWELDRLRHRLQAEEFGHQNFPLIQAIEAAIAALHGSEAGPTREQVIQRAIADGHKRAYERLNLCPDHRDKATGRCIVCQAEERTRQEIRAKAGPQEAREELFAERLTQVSEMHAQTRGTDLGAYWEGYGEGLKFARNYLTGSEAGVSARVLEWQDISTAPADSEVFFWVVPKTPEESYCNSSGDPIFSTHPPRLHRGRLKTWSALEKATHWMPLPTPPSAPAPLPAPRCLTPAECQQLANDTGLKLTALDGTIYIPLGTDSRNQ